MRKLMVTVGAGAILLASSLAALAAEATGSIASIDPAAGSVTLDDGNTYMLPTPAEAANFQVGQQVKITYEQTSDGKRKASQVTPGS